MNLVNANTAGSFPGDEVLRGARIAVQHERGPFCEQCRGAHADEFTALAMVEQRVLS